ITDHHLQSSSEDTIVRGENETTKPYGQGQSKEDKPKKKSKKKKWIIISSVFFILLAAAVLAIFVLPNWFLPKEVDVPDVTGDAYEDAVYELEENFNLVVEKESAYSSDIEEDHVVKTEPKAGRSVKEGSTVTVFVSQGKKPIQFKDYVGRVEEQVIFEVSIGPELVSLKNLKGMTESEAKDYLEDNNLKMNKLEENSESVPEGEVIRQNPETDTDLEEGSTVDVYISIGEEEKPPTFHTVSFTVSYTGSGEDGDVTDEDETDVNNE